MARVLLTPGARVRLLTDNGWGAPGCVMGRAGDRWRVFWPEENIFTCERPADLIPYGPVASQPPEVAA